MKVLFNKLPDRFFIQHLHGKKIKGWVTADNKNSVSVNPYKDNALQLKEKEADALVKRITNDQEGEYYTFIKVRCSIDDVLKRMEENRKVVISKASELIH